MSPHHATHDLLRVAGVESLVGAEHPLWVSESLRRAPWVVVRRLPKRPGHIPVGVRGECRADRYGTWIEEGAILATVTPPALVQSRSWRSHPRRPLIPAIDVLDAVSDIMTRHGLDQAWGPTGSVGFELASGFASATRSSDLDLALWADRPLERGTARSLAAALATLAVRSDALIETRQGAVALAELARGGAVMMRTAAGPRLVDI